MAKTVISVGAGHGGKDSGAVGAYGLLEKNINLAVARRLQALLAGTGAFDVKMIRDGDVYIPVADRGRQAAAWGSKCHVEVHINAFDGKASYAAVWRSCDLPGDAGTAEKMSAALAAALGVPDGGQRVRYSASQGGGDGADYQHEDYYGVIDKAQDGGVPHVFLAECGFLDYAPTAEKYKQGNGVELAAAALAKTVCGLFAVSLTGGGSTPSVPSSPSADQTALYFTVARGTYYIRSGPGTSFAALTTVAGGATLRVLAQENGWCKVTAKGKTGYIGPAAGTLSGNQAGGAVYPSTEAVKKGVYYVRTGPSTTADILGTVRGGEVWNTLNTGGWRKISYGGKVGYVGPAAWN